MWSILKVAIAYIKVMEIMMSDQSKQRIKIFCAILLVLGLTLFILDMTVLKVDGDVGFLVILGSVLMILFGLIPLLFLSKVSRTMFRVFLDLLGLDF